MEGLMSKVVHVFPAFRPGGGPAGYAYNLHQALELVGTGGILRLVVPSGPKCSSSTSQAAKRFRKPLLLKRLLRRLPPFILGPLVALRAQRNTRNAFQHLGFTCDEVTEITTARAVIFHDWRLANAYLRMGNRPLGQTVLVMSHSPTDATSERVEDWCGSFGPSRVWSGIRRLFIGLELGTLLSCDGLLAPCRQSLEHYFLDVPGRERIFEHRIYEVKSGVSELVAQRTREQVLADWDVPPDAKIVGYFGRRHAHKGYDLFCQAAEIAHEKEHTDLYFISVGAGHLPSPCNLPNFRDLGYLRAGLADAIGAVDLVVVPNRVSYFDLLILEAMSLGKAILTSRVGGNVCFGSPGIFFFEELTAESLASAIVSLLSDPRMLEEAGKVNRSTYEQCYSLKAFGTRQLEFARFLLEMET